MVLFELLWDFRNQFQNISGVVIPKQNSLFPKSPPNSSVFALWNTNSEGYKFSFVLLLSSTPELLK